MTLAYHEHGIALHRGDCLHILAELPNNSIDAMVTDPPAGIAFMNKTWDGNRGGRDQWIAWLTTRLTETMRVLKPGAHALVWALPRTSHWTALALEDAGYEIRDCITHLFGTGFPKSLDIGKAIDRTAGVERVVIGRSFRHGGGVVGAGSSYEVSPDVPMLTAPATDAAKEWDGWGTALKPAGEMWWLARKPITRTIAHNVMEYGTGGININASRVHGLGGGTRCTSRDEAGKCLGHRNAGRSTSGETFHGADTTPAGRWPPNVVLTHQPLLTEHGDIVGDACEHGCVEGCPVAELDAQSGNGTSRIGKSRAAAAPGHGWGMTATGSEYCDSGGASRFFPTFRYQAKAPTSERPKIDGKAHPTVKALALMQWATRLITPPAGTILDPFCGTGTTGQAARTQGFNAVLIDNDPESVEWTIQRLTTTLL